MTQQNQQLKPLKKGTDSYIALLDNKFNELIQMKPRINKLSDMEKRKFNALQRDIEWYSVDLEKYSSIAQKLDKLERLPREEIEKIKQKKQVKKESKQIKKTPKRS